MKICNPVATLAQFTLLFLLACGPKPASVEAKAVAACLEAKGIKMYGAFWCPHCAAQKAIFGDAYPSSIYIECSNADRTQKDVCNAANIVSYPTWEFAEGKRAKGEQTLEELSQQAGCEGG